MEENISIPQTRLKKLEEEVNFMKPYIEKILSDLKGLSCSKAKEVLERSILKIDDISQSSIL